MRKRGFHYSSALFVGVYSQCVDVTFQDNSTAAVKYAIICAFLISKMQTLLMLQFYLNMLFLVG